jgi:hypothetical protein
MSTGSRVAGAVAAGYALGRFKKLRLAVLVATAMSSPKFRDAAFGLIENRIPGGAIVGTLSKEVGSKLLDAGKAAATSVVASRIDSLSENLAGRSNNMRGGAPNGQSRSRADEAADDRGSTEPEDEASEEEEEPEAEYDEEETDEAEEPEAEYDEEETDEAEEPEAEYDEEETDEAEEPEAEYDEEDEEETDEPEAEYDEEDEEETDEAEEPEAEDAARVRDDGDSADEEDEEPVARSPRRRRSASPAGRRRG